MLSSAKAKANELVGLVRLCQIEIGVIAIITIRTRDITYAYAPLQGERGGALIDLFEK